MVHGVVILFFRAHVLLECVELAVEGIDLVVGHLCQHFLLSLVLPVISVVDL